MENILNFLSELGIAFLIILGVSLIALFVERSSSKRPRAQNSFDRDRQLANIQILTILAEYARTHPSQRFGQILRNTGVLEDVLVQERGMEEWESGNVYVNRNILHEEPSLILERVKKELANHPLSDILLKSSQTK